MVRTASENTDSTEARRSKFRFRLSAVLFAVAGIALVLAIMRFGRQAIHGAHENAQQSVCRGHLSQLNLALLNYEDRFGSFPPASVRDSDGKPAHSWRVLILPFLEQQELFDAYCFDEPWNGPRNRRLADSMPPVFRCPSEPYGRPRHLTNYVAVVGQYTAFSGSGTSSLRDLPDRGENTLLVAEVTSTLVHWMEPIDINADQMSFHINDTEQPSLSSVHPKGPGIICVRSPGAWRFAPNTPPDVVRRFVESKPGESITVKNLIEQGWLRR